MRESMLTLETPTLTSIKNILYPTDLSAAGDLALPFVYDIARMFSARVTALYVRTPEVEALQPPLAFPYQQEFATDPAQEVIDALDSRLGALEHENIVGDGEVWDFIAKVLDDREIDLIVMGTHGRTGFEKFLLGSVAEVVFRQANCPVLTIGPRVSRNNIPWKLNNIIIASDFTPEAIAAGQAAFWLAKECHSRVTLLHVLETPESGDLLDPHQYITSAARVLEHEVPKGMAHECQVSYVINDGVPADEILRVARERDSNLIVLGVRSAAGHLGAATHLSRPIAHKVVSKASCPVLTVRA
jgi:nucleotide-binding universal stress UspA family protein